MKAENLRDFLPDTLHIPNLSLDTELPFSSDLASDLLDFVCEDGELVNHVIDGVDQAQHFSRHTDTDYLLGEISPSDRSLQNNYYYRQSEARS